MILEIKQWPESQEVMKNPDWFFVMGTNDNPIRDSAYARILDKDEYTLTRDTKKVKGTSVPVYNEGDANIIERWVCYYCGENTYDVDYEYIGSCTNHLDCELKSEDELRRTSKKL